MQLFNVLNTSVKTIKQFEIRLKSLFPLRKSGKSGENGMMLLQSYLRFFVKTGEMLYKHFLLLYMKIFLRSPLMSLIKLKSILIGLKFLQTKNSLYWFNILTIELSTISRSKFPRTIHYK